MNPDRWRAVEDLFDAAADLPDGERVAFVRGRCGDDTDLEAEVLSLLRASPGVTGRIHGAIDSGIDLARAPAAEGRRLGPYRITREVGRGGMGAVYLAVRDDDQYRNEVAIKLLQYGLDTAQSVARFRSERQILASLQHPGIVRLLDGGSTDDGLPYLVMEYVEGVPLTTFVAKEELSVRQRVELVRTVCSAVQYAHQKLVVHRDIKPHNILVTADGTPKLLDFGIATLLAEDGAQAARTRTGMHLLTPEYASPEQVRGEPVSTATDVYSLGLVLYEVLTGCSAQRPEREGTEELMRAVLERVPARPSTVGLPASRSALAGDLDNIVLKALEKEPARRYPSVEALSEDLLRYLDGRPVSARAATWRYLAAKFARRNAVPLAAIGIVLAALTTATGVSLDQARRADEQARIAQQRFEDVRHLTNTLLFDVDEKIRDVSGTTAARELIVSRALEYLDALAADPGADESLSRERAIAYIKVGDIQGIITQPNLGRPQDALQSYARAEEILLGLPTQEHLDTRWGLVQARLGRSLVFYGEDEMQTSRAEADAARGVLEAIPRGPAYRYDVATLAYMHLAALDRHLGGDGVGAAEHSLQIASEWQRERPSAESAYFVGVADQARGQARAAAGDPEGALADLALATATFRRLTSEYPDSAAYRRELAYALQVASWIHCATWLRSGGDCAAGEAALRESIEQTERLVAADPDDARARVQLLNALSDVATIVAQRDPAGALGLVERSRAVEAGLPAESRDSGYVRHYAVVRECAAAEPLVRVGRLDDARSVIEQTLVGAGDPDFVSEPPGARQLCLYRLSRALRALGDQGRAVETLDVALAELRRMVADQPSSIVGYVGLGESLELRGDLVPSERCASLEEAVRAWRSWPGRHSEAYVARLAELEVAASSCF